MTNKFSIQPVSWSYEKNLSTKPFQFSIQTTTCLEDMEKPYHQILPILYLDYHVFGGYGKNSSPNPSNSLSRLPRVWMEKEKPHHQILLQFSFQTTTCLGDMEKPYHQILGGKRKNLITKSFSNSLSRLPHVWGIWKNLITKSLEGKGKTSSPNPSPILYLDYHIFGGYGKTLSRNPWREKEKPHHQILLQFSI